MLRTLTLICVLSFPPLVVNSQSLVDVCLSLSSGGLKDTRKTSTIVDTFASEFRHVCSSQSNKLKRYRGSSQGFQGAFKGYGLSFSGANETSLSESQISKWCDRGESSFASYLRVEDEISVGQYLSNNVLACASLLQSENREAIIGTTSVSEDDSYFNVNINYSIGERPVIYRLSRVVGEVECFSDNLTDRTSAVNNIVLNPNSGNAFVCTKPVGAAVAGSFVFTGRINDKDFESTVKFDVDSRTYAEEVHDAALKMIDDKIEIYKSGRIIATGTFRCAADLVIGPNEYEEACRHRVTLSATRDYDVVMTPFIFNYPKDSIPPIYYFLIENKSLSGFDAVVRTAYHHLNSMQLRWIAISK